jgi:hypothetical protein
MSDNSESWFGWLKSSRVYDVGVILIGVAAMLIAGRGWWLVHTPSEPIEWIDLLVRTVKVLFLSDIYYDPARDASWHFQTSRALGTTFAILAGGKAFWLALRSSWLRARLSGRRRHDVVIGDGPLAKTYVLMQGARKITVLGEHASGPVMARVAASPRSGSLEQQLRGVGAQHARLILVDQGDEVQDLETVRAIERLHPKTPVACRVDDAWLLERIDRSPDATSRLAVGLAEGAARQILLAHPPYILARRYKAEAQHIVIFGFGATGQALAREMLLTCGSLDPAGRMMITAVGADADHMGDIFNARHPSISGLVDMAFLQGCPGDLRPGDKEDSTLPEALAARLAKTPACAVYIVSSEAGCTMSDIVSFREYALQTGLTRAPIFVMAERGSSLTRVRQGGGRVGEPWTTTLERREIEEKASIEGRICDLRLVPFGAAADALDGSGLLEPEIDRRAQQFHEAYRTLMKTTYPDALKGASMQPWSVLAETYRVASRRAANHIRAKLDAAGFNLDEWLGREKQGRRAHDLPAEARTFHDISPETLEKLSQLEHDRWLLDRSIEGWIYGKPRNNTLKVHPDMEPWSALDEPTREKDRNNVRESARILDEIIAASTPKGARK